MSATLLSMNLLQLQQAAGFELPEAMTVLGIVFENGLGMKENQVRAHELFEGAASRGNAFAGYCLAERYLTGIGVPTDFGQAVHWYEQSARRGFAPAMLALSTLHEAGYGVTRNNAKALAYATEAADLGYPPALAALAHMHAGGIGIDRNEDEALRLYQRAGDAGDADACLQAAALMERLNADDPSTAVAWYRRAADLGSREARDRLVEIYTRGLLGEKIDLDRAREYAKR